ncbi:hypothetical protein FQZ97_916380 [compost metagenome]
MSDPLFGRKAVVGEHLVDDLQRGLVLKDLVVAGACGQDQPRPQDDFVDASAVLVLHKPCTCHQTIDFACTRANASCCSDAFAVEFDADAEFFADQLFDRYVGRQKVSEFRAVGGLQPDGVFEEFPQCLAAVERLEFERWLGQQAGHGRAADGDGS